jgi:hypothetical protein
LLTLRAARSVASARSICSINQREASNSRVLYATMSPSGPTPPGTLWPVLSIAQGEDASG